MTTRAIEYIPPIEYEITPIVPPVEDAFRYGWREHEVETPDGKRMMKRTPLTLEDVLHPQEGDYIVESHDHELHRGYVAYVSRYQMRHRKDVIVLSDVRTDWGHRFIRPHAPDIGIFENVAEEKAWPTFYVQKENARPLVIFELVSPSTRVNYVYYKLLHYAQVGVPLYVILDSQTRHGEKIWSVDAYTLNTTGDYEPIFADEEGRVWLEALQIYVGTSDGQIACFDRNKERIGDYNEVSAERDAAKARALEAEQRNLELEAELAQLRKLLGGTDFQSVLHVTRLPHTPSSQYIPPR